MSTTKSEIFQS